MIGSQWKLAYLNPSWSPENLSVIEYYTWPFGYEPCAQSMITFWTSEVSDRWAAGRKGLCKKHTFLFLSGLLHASLRSISSITEPCGSSPPNRLIWIWFAGTQGRSQVVMATRWDPEGDRREVMEASERGVRDHRSRRCWGRCRRAAIV